MQAAARNREGVGRRRAAIIRQVFLPTQLRTAIALSHHTSAHLARMRSGSSRTVRVTGLSTLIVLLLSLFTTSSFRPSLVEAIAILLHECLRRDIAKHFAKFGFIFNLQSFLNFHFFFDICTRSLPASNS